MAGRITMLRELRMEDHCPIGRSSVVSIWLTDPKHPSTDGVLICSRDHKLHRMWPHVADFSVHVRVRKPGCEEGYERPVNVAIEWAGRRLCEPTKCNPAHGDWRIWRGWCERVTLPGADPDSTIAKDRESANPCCEPALMPLEACLRYLYVEAPTVRQGKKEEPKEGCVKAVEATFNQAEMERTEVVLVARFHLAP